MIASVAQIGVQPAPAKLPPAGTSPTSFAQVMEQHQASVHGTPDQAISQSPGNSKPASSGALKTTGSQLGLATDRPASGKTKKEAEDSPDTPKQDSHDNPGSNALVAQIVAPIPAPPAPLPAAPAQPVDAIAPSSAPPSPTAKSSANVATPAFSQTLPSAHFVNALHEELSTKMADALPRSKATAKIEDGKAKTLPEDAGPVDTIPSDNPENDPKGLSSDIVRPASDPNASVASAKVAAEAKQLPEDSGLSRSKLPRPIDVPQQAENENVSHIDAAKPDKTNSGGHPAQNNASSAQSQTSAINSVDVPTVQAMMDPTSTTKVAEIKEAKLPAVAPQPTSSPRQVSPTSFSSQAASQAPASKEANAAHGGKEEKKDDDSGEAIQDAQQVPIATPKDSAAPPPNSSFSHVMTQATNVKDHTLQSAGKDVVPGTLAHLHATETPAPESAVAAALLHSKVLQRIGQSELRVGIQAGEFGNVDIRTSMSRNQVTTEISVDHGELGRMLAAELPSLQNKLAEHHIPPASLVLQTQTSGSFSDSGHRSGNWQRTPQAQNVFTSYAGEHNESRTFVAPESNGSASGLDIHL